MIITAKVISGKIHCFVFFFFPLDKDKADKVFWAMMGIFNYLYWQKNGAPPSYEDLARMWSGGPMGYEKEATLRYLEKFKNM